METGIRILVQKIVQVRDVSPESNNIGDTMAAAAAGKKAIIKKILMTNEIFFILIYELAF